MHLASADSANGAATIWRLQHLPTATLICRHPLLSMLPTARSILPMRAGVELTSGSCEVDPDSWRSHCYRRENAIKGSKSPAVSAA